MLLTGALLLQACGESDLPQRSLQADDCLREVNLQQLPQAIRRCDQVVARFPRDPAPRNERALLLSLNGQDQAACREIPLLQPFFEVAIEGSHRNKTEINGRGAISANIADSGEQLRKLG